MEHHILNNIELCNHVMTKFEQDSSKMNNSIFGKTIAEMHTENVAEGRGGGGGGGG